MKYEYYFGKIDSEIRKEMETEQFKLSEELLDLRYELSLKTEELAKITNLSEQEYLKLEYGESSIDVKVYKDAINKIKSFSKEIKTEYKNYFEEKRNIL